ncbi:MAG: hypothetical protein K2Q32_04620 [Alphaproteobacteria bacterium]|nr:hypothetical protein [Alphaproteobacteria bacterium]
MTGTQPAVTHLPGHTYAKPADAPSKAQTAPIKAVIQQIAPPVKIATVAAPPAKVAEQAAPTTKIVTATPPKHQHVEPTRVSVTPTTTNYNTYNNYGTPPRRDYRPHPQDNRPHPQNVSQKKSNGFLFGLGLGILGAGVLGNGMRTSYSSGYRYPSTQYGSQYGSQHGSYYGSQYGSSTTMEDPMTPDQFNSMLNAAIDRRGNTRIDRDSYFDNAVPTTPRERKMFKQISFNLLQRAGKIFDERDERAMFIPGILDDGKYPMPKNERGTHITHFNSNFRDPDFSQMAAENRRLLLKEYTAEYRLYQREMGTQEPRHYQQTAFNSRPTNIFRIF